MFLFMLIVSVLLRKEENGVCARQKRRDKDVRCLKIM